MIEGNNFMIDLSVSEMADPFPPSVSSQWTHNQQNLLESNSITLDTYSISFNNILRNYTGQYTLTVTNTVGSVTGSFTLNVQC